MIAEGWDVGAHDLWLAGRHRDSISAALAAFAEPGRATPALAIQSVYYLFLGGDYANARSIIGQALGMFPDDPELLHNLGVVCGRTGDVALSREALERYRALGGVDVNALDGLTDACRRLGDEAAALDYGRQALVARTLPPTKANRLVLGPRRSRGHDIIAFSLWSDDPRYLRGALHNLLQSRSTYPSFACRFYIDDSVPADLIATLRGEGADIVEDHASPDSRRRLTRRFLVADDPEVRRYLVRDCDSVVSEREAAAVVEWCAGDLPFHVMRDWWTHTNVMLAGMWGGIGGVLPPLEPLLDAYQPDQMETQHWDQWFLRDLVWPSINSQCIVHDRLFRPPGSCPFPTPDPPGNTHVGQDEYAVRRNEQAALLASFARSVPSLRL